jgi:hypothetical protein
MITKQPAMFSRILIKLIDQSIVPAVLLVGVRILSVVLVANYFGINYTLGPEGFVYPDPASYLTVNSYSVMFMVIVLAVGLFYILLKSLLFHETHIAPHLTAKLFSFRLSSFIQTSYDLYSQGAVWLSYMYLMMFASGIMVFFNLLYAWVFYVSLVLTIISTVLLIFDVENELDLRTDNKRAKIEEDFILQFKETHV